MRVNVETSVRTEPRFKRLAKALDLPLPHALGHALCVWIACYDRRDAVMAEVDVDAAAERPGFAQALIASQLAERAGGGHVRVCGVADRIAYLNGVIDLATRAGQRSGEVRRHGLGMDAATEALSKYLHEHPDASGRAAMKHLRAAGVFAGSRWFWETWERLQSAKKEWAIPQNPGVLPNAPEGRSGAPKPSDYGPQGAVAQGAPERKPAPGAAETRAPERRSGAQKRSRTARMDSEQEGAFFGPECSRTGAPPGAPKVNDYRAPGAPDVREHGEHGNSTGIADLSTGCSRTGGPFSPMNTALPNAPELSGSGSGSIRIRKEDLDHHDDLDPQAPAPPDASGPLASPSAPPGVPGRDEVAQDPQGGTRTPAAPAKTAPRARQAPKNGSGEVVPGTPWGRVVEAWWGAYRGRTGVEPSRHGHTFGPLRACLDLANGDPAEVERRIEILFRWPPPFLAASVPDPKTLYQHWDKLAAPATRRNGAAPGHAPASAADSFPAAGTYSAAEFFGKSGAKR